MTSPRPISAWGRRETAEHQRVATALVAHWNEKSRILERVLAAHNGESVTSLRGKLVAVLAKRCTVVPG